MTEQNKGNLRLREQLTAGTSLADLPEAPDVALSEVLNFRVELRESSLELFADSVFYKAAKKLVDLLDDEDPQIVLKAASKLIDLRRDTYKVRSNAKTMMDLGDKLFDDGFNFTRK